MADPRKQAFTLPEAFGGPDKSYDYVFDLTAETDWDASEEVSWAVALHYPLRTHLLNECIAPTGLPRADGETCGLVRKGGDCETRRRAEGICQKYVVHL